MAARAIVGIALGMLLAPVLYILIMTLDSTGLTTGFTDWGFSIVSDFNGFIRTYFSAGAGSLLETYTFGMLTIPFITLITTPLITLGNWFAIYGAAIVVWVVMGMWAGAVERSPGRGIGVGVGIWLGWFVVRIILSLIDPIAFGPIALSAGLILDSWFCAVIVIIVAAVMGAICKSEEF